jgi:site-specific recombinase XerD
LFHFERSAFQRLVWGASMMGRFKLYDLRHSFASHLLDQGVKITDVAYALGHAKPTTTLTFYAHPLQSDMAYIDRLTAARQRAAGDLNGDFVRTKRRGK